MTPARASRRPIPAAVLVLLAVAACVATAALGQAPASLSDVKPPQPTVPEIFTLKGQFVRVAYNNEGYATLGYRIANSSAGEEWMLLDAGFTVLKGTPNYVLKRDALSIRTPDGQTVPLATQKDYMEAGYLRALNARAKVGRDSLNYFPVEANRACAMQFFADSGGGPGRLAYDEVELSHNRACVGRLYFKVPGGIKIGQHWLVVQLASSRLEVPFRILTPEEEKFLRKNWEDLGKELDEALRK
ncbi:MAG: hypothetical protein EDX89_05210 [Acidobacteria bacterium]|nr:MAG: hypothetical protein EDX89_05210 [Acidobacteriota bacterium]MCE7958291.1 hypothetical protein [Acidobacteria bacterium ACB2]